MKLFASLLLMALFFQPSIALSGMTVSEIRRSGQAAMRNGKTGDADKLFANACELGDAWSCRDRGRIATSMGLNLRARRYFAYACLGGLRNQCKSASELWQSHGAVKTALLLRERGCALGETELCDDRQKNASNPTESTAKEAVAAPTSPAPPTRKDFKYWRQQLKASESDDKKINAQ